MAEGDVHITLQEAESITLVMSQLGLRGKQGKLVEFQASATYIQYRYEGDTVWIDLIALSTITGPAGPAGGASKGFVMAMS
jgi:hypothetical protein